MPEWVSKYKRPQIAVDTKSSQLTRLMKLL